MPFLELELIKRSLPFCANRRYLQREISLIFSSLIQRNDADWHVITIQLIYANSFPVSAYIVLYASYYKYCLLHKKRDYLELADVSFF